MDAPPSITPEARQILKLARENKRAAQDALAALSLEDQVFLVCAAPLVLRSRLLELTPAPEQVIPLLPEAELCFTAKAVGLADAGWILEHATSSQLAASIDLDGWTGIGPARESLRAWLEALADAGDETLWRAAQALDPELIVLMLRDRVHVMLDPKDEFWQAPEGAQTLEGQFYILPKRPGDDLEDLLKLLHVLFQQDYWLYFRMLQGVIWELESDLEEWALRWRTGRLEDLGFPSWDEAMRIYGYLRPSERDAIPADDHPLDIDAWQLPVFLPELPATVSQAHPVFRAAAELGENERRGFFYAFVAMANKVAVADGLPLGDAGTLPAAIEAAATVVSQGLEHVAARNQIGLAETLRRASLERLFRVGASLSGRKPPASAIPPEPDEDLGLVPEEDPAR
jgi:hypothetical protein